VHALGPDGKLRWKLNTGDEVTALACLDLDADGADEALVASLSGNVYAARGDGSLVWRTDLGSAVADLSVAGDKVCALTADGRVCALTARTGAWLASSALGSPGVRLVATQDGTALVAATEDGRLLGLTW
jgi:outer membrane protein assembly factor BamB